MYVDVKESRYICELVFQGGENVIESGEIWSFVSERLKAVHDTSMSADEVKSYWMNYLQFNIGTFFKINEPLDLPIFEESDTDETTKMKSNQRIEIFKKLYKKLFSSLKFSINFTDGANRVILTQTNTNQPINTIGNLFENWSFYLPKGQNLLEETERWKAEILVRAYGGELVTLQGEIKPNTVVLGFGSLVNHLLWYPIFYKAMVHNPKIISKCVKSNKKLTQGMLNTYALFGDHTKEPDFCISKMTPIPGSSP